MKYHGFNPEIYAEFLEQALEHYDYARCQRPDGSYYGTAGKCRKGTEVGAREKKVSRKSQVAKIKSLKNEGKALLEKGNSKEGLAKLNEAIKLQNELPPAPVKKAVSNSKKRDKLDEYWKERANISESKYNEKVEAMGDPLKRYKNASPEAEARVAKQQATYNKLSSDEKAAVQMYGQAGDREEIYVDLNMKLRTGKNPPAEKKEAVDFVESNLKSGLSKLPDQEGTFYRAVSGGGAQALANVRIGDTIQDDGFGSYADRGGPKIAPFIDRKAENIVMVVRGKRLKNVSPVMPYQEGEHLSMPGTKLKLVDIQPEGYYSRKVGSIPTYVFEEV